MFKRDALSRGLGAAWVVIFLATLLLPIGFASGASRPTMDATEFGGLSQIVDAQVADPPVLGDAAEPPESPPPVVSDAPPPVVSDAPPPAPVGAPQDSPSEQQRVLSAQATLQVRQGLVEYSPAGSSDFQTAQDGQVVTEGARVRTGNSGSARLVYLEGSSTDISPNTALLVQELQQSGGNPITNLLQSAGTTLHRVNSLVDSQARFQVETPAATAFIRGTSAAIGQRPRTEENPCQFLFQNVSDAGSGDVFRVTGSDRTITLSPNQETLASCGTGPSPVVSLGRSDQSARNQQLQADAAAGGVTAAAMASAASAAVMPGLAQSVPLQQQQLAQVPPIGPPVGGNPGLFVPPPPPPPPVPMVNGPGSNVFCITATPVRTLTITPTTAPTNTPTTNPTLVTTPVVPSTTPVVSLTPSRTPTNTVAPANTATALPVANVTTPQVTCAPTPGVQNVVIAPGGVPTPGLTGTAGSSCAAATGGTCTFPAGVQLNGTFTRLAGGNYSFNVNATGPAGTAVGGTAIIFIPTSVGVESFTCSAVSAALTTNCTGTTVGAVRSGAVITVRFPLLGGGTADVSATLLIAGGTATPVLPTPTNTPVPFPPLPGNDVTTDNADGASASDIFATSRLNNTVSFINGLNNTITGRLVLPSIVATNAAGVPGPVGITYVPAIQKITVGPTLYTANFGDGTVSVIDVATQTVRQSIDLRQAAAIGPPAVANPQPVDIVGIDIGDPSTRIFVTDQAGGMVHIIDPVTNRVMARMCTGGAPAAGPCVPANSPQGIDACTDCGGVGGLQLVFIANRGNNTVTVINALTLTVSRTLTLGFTGPTGVLSDRNNGGRANPVDYVYITNFNANPATVTVLDTRCLFGTRPAPAAGVIDNCAQANTTNGTGPIASSGVVTIVPLPGASGAYRASAKELGITAFFPSPANPGLTVSFDTANRVYVTGMTSNTVSIFNITENPLQQGTTPAVTFAAIAPSTTAGGCAFTSPSATTTGVACSLSGMAVGSTATITIPVAGGGTATLTCTAAAGQTASTCSSAFTGSPAAGGTATVTGGGNNASGTITGNPAGTGFAPSVGAVTNLGPTFPSSTAVLSQPAGTDVNMAMNRAYVMDNGNNVLFTIEGQTLIGTLSVP